MHTQITNIEELDYYHGRRFRITMLIDGTQVSGELSEPYNESEEES